MRGWPVPRPSPPGPLRRRLRATVARRLRGGAPPRPDRTGREPHAPLVPPVRLVDPRFGYALTLPPGWRAACGDGFPVARSADLRLLPPGGHRRQSMRVVACPRPRATCLAPRTAGATRSSTTLGGTPATLLTTGPGRGGRAGAGLRLEVDALHGTYAYAISLHLPPGRGTQRAAWDALLRSWVWLPGPAGAPRA